MHVEIEQRGIDVVVSLFAPDGTKLVEMNNRTLSYGQEALSFAADNDGTFRFEVSTVTPPINGHYVAPLERTSQFHST